MTKEEQERLLEICMYALLPKEIYNHELDISTRNKFMDIIRHNLNDNTSMLRDKIKSVWNDREEIQDNQMNIYKILEDCNE